MKAYREALEALRNAADLGLPVPLPALETIEQAHCSTCVHMQPFTLSKDGVTPEWPCGCMASGTASVEFWQGSPTTFGCPFWERGEAQP